MEIRALLPTDDRAVFRSGDDDLDRFLRRFAGQNQFRHHLGVTYVAVEEGILGYATVAPGNMEIQDLPKAARRRLPQYPLPILRLARLGVDSTAHGRGIGSALLRFVFELARQMALDFGCVGFSVDAKPGAEAFYEGMGFFRLDVCEGASDARPAPAAMFLPLSAIEAARGP